MGALAAGKNPAQTTKNALFVVRALALHYLCTSKELFISMIDLFIIVLLAWALFSGWRAGLVKELISSVGMLVGLLVAATCYGAFGQYLAVDGSESNQMTSVVAFLILWIVVPIVLGFVANVLTRALKGMALGMPNSILGAVVSGVKYVLLISCVLNVMEALGIMNEEKTEQSHLYRPVTGALSTFFPEDTTTVERGDTVWIDMTQKHQDNGGK